MKEASSRSIPKELDHFLDQVQSLAHRSGEETYDEVNSRLLECLAMIGGIICYGMKTLFRCAFTLIALIAVSILVQILVVH